MNFQTPSNNFNLKTYLTIRNITLKNIIKDPNYGDPRTTSLINIEDVYNASIDSANAFDLLGITFINAQNNKLVNVTNSECLFTDLSYL